MRRASASSVTWTPRTRKTEASIAGHLYYWNTQSDPFAHPSKRPLDEFPAAVNHQETEACLLAANCSGAAHASASADEFLFFALEPLQGLAPFCIGLDPW